MAYNRNQQARIDVYIGGTTQAKKQLQEMKNEAAQLSKEIESMKQQQLFELDPKAYDELGKKIQESEKRFKSMNKVIRDTERQIYNISKELSDLSGETERNLKSSRNYYQQQLARTDPKDLEKMQYNASMLNKIMEELERRKKNIEGFATIFGNIRDVSDKALSTLRQRLQEVMGTTKEGTEEMARFSEQLRTVEMEQSRRVTQQAKTTLGQVQTGTFDGTIGQTKEAIKLLEEYKQKLKISDTKGIKEVEDAIATLNGKIKTTSDEVISLDEALDKAGEVGMGTFDGTYEDLQQLKKTLQDYQSQLKVGNTKQLDKIRNAFKDIESAEQAVSNKLVNVDDVMKRLRTAPLEELQQASAQLQKELTESTRRTEEYVKTSAKLRQVSAQIDDVKKSWQEHDNQIVATAKRLS